MFYFANITWCVKMRKPLGKLDPNSICPGIGFRRNTLTGQRRRIADRLNGTENVDKSNQIIFIVGPIS